MYSLARTYSYYNHDANKTTTRLSMSERRNNGQFARQRLIFWTILLNANGTPHIWIAFYAIWMHCVGIKIISHFSRISRFQWVPLEHIFHTTKEQRQNEFLWRYQRSERLLWKKMWWLWFVFHWFPLAVSSESQTVHVRMVVNRRVSLAHAQMPHFARLPLFAFVCKTSQFNKADEYGVARETWTWYCVAAGEAAGACRDHDRQTTERTFFATLMDEPEHD